MAKEIKLPEKTVVPSNWSWTEMGKLVQTKTGYPFDSKRFSDGRKGGRPLVRIRDVLRGNTETFTDEVCSEEYTVHFGDILIGMDGDFNTAKWRSGDSLLNQRVCRIKSAGGLLLNDFLYYYLPIPLKRINEITPSVTVKHLSTKTLDNLPLPLPPIQEQHRIVARIESLFAKLDEAKEKLQAVVDGYEIRRAAILHRAFAGELTAKWRKEHGVGMESWKYLKIGDFAEVKGGKRLPKGHKLVTERTMHPYLRIVDFGAYTIDTSDLRYITDDTFEQISRYVVRKGDVYLSIVGSIGKAGTIPDELDGANLTENAARIISKQTVPEFLSMFLSSPMAQDDIKKRIRSATLGKLSLLNVKDMQVPLPLLAEQIEITQILHRFFALEDLAFTSAQAALAQIDLIKKSILVRAFRGELGTNDPEEVRAELPAVQGII